MHELWGSFSIVQPWDHGMFVVIDQAVAELRPQDEEWWLNLRFTETARLRVPTL